MGYNSTIYVLGGLIIVLPDKVYRTATGGGARIVDKYKKLNKQTKVKSVWFKEELTVFADCQKLC